MIEYRKGPKGPEEARRAQRRPEGHKGSPKGLKLEVGAQRAPRLLVNNKFSKKVVNAFPPKDLDHFVVNDHQCGY